MVMGENANRMVGVEKFTSQLKEDQDKVRFFAMSIGQRVGYGLLDLEEAYEEVNEFIIRNKISISDEDRLTLVPPTILKGKADGEKSIPIGMGDKKLEYAHILFVLLNSQITPHQRYFEANVILKMIASNKSVFTFTKRSLLESTGVKLETVKSWENKFKYLSVEFIEKNPKKPKGEVKFRAANIMKQHFWPIPNVFLRDWAKSVSSCDNVFHAADCLFEHWEDVQNYGLPPGPVWPHQNMWLHRGAGKGLHYLIYLVIYLFGPITIKEITTLIGASRPQTITKTINQYLIPIGLIEIGKPSKTTNQRKPTKTYQIVPKTAFTKVDESLHSIPDTYGQLQIRHAKERKLYRKHQDFYYGR